jgi:hypothetical protein
MLQKRAPNDLKSLDAELKSAPALRGAAGRARPAQREGPSLRFCKGGRFLGRAFQGFTARADARRSASDARYAAEGRRGETWTSRSPNYRRPVSRARGMSRSSAAGKANWLRDPKETFPGCKALKNHETGKESRPPRGVAVGPRSISAALTRVPCPAACRSLCKALAGLDEERRRRYGASGRPFVPGAARVKATCYFFCDFT